MPICCESSRKKSQAYYYLYISGLIYIAIASENNFTTFSPHIESRTLAAKYSFYFFGIATFKKELFKFEKHTNNGFSNNKNFFRISVIKKIKTIFYRLCSHLHCTSICSITTAPNDSIPHETVFTNEFIYFWRVLIASIKMSFHYYRRFDLTRRLIGANRRDIWA